MGDINQIMETKDSMRTENWMGFGPLENQFLQKSSSESDNQYFASSKSHPDQVELKGSSFMDYEMRLQQSSVEKKNSLNRSSSLCGEPISITKFHDNMSVQTNQVPPPPPVGGKLNWDPNAMLNNLSFLEVKIHQLQDIVHLIVGRKSEVADRSDELIAQQQQLISADLTSIIVQLISTAGSLLPSVTQNISTADSAVGQFDGILFPSGNENVNVMLPQSGEGVKFPDLSNRIEPVMNNHVAEQSYLMEEHEMKDEEDVEEGEHLAPGSYEILQLEKEEILAPHTHFCTICGKGFKRDANLRMHMRGHGDEYKSPAALAKPTKECSSEPVLIKRYSCPYSGCKRNKDHKMFQPLKTILCVKNHYKRSHCDKSFTCSRCNTKKFSVIADLKTHEKHCGRDKWLCSCGTTFSRKDKLFGHIALFQGHTPAIPLDEKTPTGLEHGEGSKNINKVTGIGFNSGCDTLISSGISNPNAMDYKATLDDPSACFSPLSFDPCNLILFQEFPRQTFEDSDSSFSFLMPGPFGYEQKNDGNNEFK